MIKELVFQLGFSLRVAVGFGLAVLVAVGGFIIGMFPLIYKALGLSSRS